MGLTFQQQDEEISIESFIRRVTQAAVKCGIAVMAEDPSTAGHAERMALAQRVFYSPIETARLMARGVVTNPNCGIGGVDDPLENDNALEFVVSSLWNAYAGYSPSAGQMATPVVLQPFSLAGEPPKRKRTVQDFFNDPFGVRK